MSRVDSSPSIMPPTSWPRVRRKLFVFDFACRQFVQLLQNQIDDFFALDSKLVPA